ncbi:Arc family DNA-binding protein [Undibacterium sp. MH2W]|uniref:Arc family DNA-binding protein n=1 Tax=Undibacterium sp. MH2W TaxID=3413044 RepID=UPI003BF25744
MEDKTKQSTPYPLRMSEDLRSKLEDEANKIGRSLHAEIITRLEKSFDKNENTPEEKIHEFFKIIDDLIAKNLKLSELLDAKIQDVEKVNKKQGRV